MAWWIVAALVLVLLVFAVVYGITLREQRALTNYVLLLLLDDEVVEHHRRDLVDFVHSRSAIGPADLGRQIYAATAKMVVREGMSDKTLDVAGRLWRLKSGDATKTTTSPPANLVK